MWNSQRLVFLFAVLLASTGCLVPAALAEDPGKLNLPRFSSTPRQTVPPEWARFRQAMTPIARDKDTLRANEERVKGIGLDIYSKVAPCVVVVRTHEGHGTGFLIDADGWLITNNHVIADAKPDPQTGALRADIHLGKWQDDHMVLLDDTVPALVYKHSPEKDLALLRLTRKPKGVPDLPFLRLADTKNGDKVQAGVDCVAIGHPAAGSLWTLREGVVSQVADWPREKTDSVMVELNIPQGQQRQRFTDLIDSRFGRRKVVLSTCGLNPGDSGGPLVNKEGKVIAVSFAEPPFDPRRGRNLAKIFYHIHLEEVKAFLENRDELSAAPPPPEVPESLTEADFFELRDLDGDGRAETLLYGPAKNVESGILVDLNNSNGKLTAEKLGSATKWKFQFAVRNEPCLSIFYDTDGDGRIDLILRDVNGDGKADLALHCEGDKWSLDKRAGGPLINPTLFRDKEQQERCHDYLTHLRKAS